MFRKYYLVFVANMKRKCEKDGAACGTCLYETRDDKGMTTTMHKHDAPRSTPWAFPTSRSHANRPTVEILIVK